MEAFSDGVFSIATTLLVLEIAVRPPGTALEQLRHEWPAYLGYGVSFLTIGAAWLAHNTITDRLTRADTLLLRINLLLLFVVAFMPFPTKLIAEALHEPDNERVFVTLYGVTLLTIRVFLFALDEYALASCVRTSSDSLCRDWQWRCTSRSPYSSSCRSETSDAFCSAAHE